MFKTTAGTVLQWWLLVNEITQQVTENIGAYLINKRFNISCSKLSRHSVKCKILPHNDHFQRLQINFSTFGIPNQLS
jgi:hypothetical protein